MDDIKPMSQAAKIPVSGPELAALMKVGARVKRGIDWKWGDQVVILAHT